MQQPSKSCTPIWGENGEIGSHCLINVKRKQRLTTYLRRNSGRHREQGRLPPSWAVTMRPAYTGPVSPSQALHLRGRTINVPVGSFKPHEKQYSKLLGLSLFQYWIWVLGSWKSRKLAKSQAEDLGAAFEIIDFISIEKKNVTSLLFQRSLRIL